MKRGHVRISHKSSFRDPYSGRTARTTRTLERNFASGGGVRQPRLAIKVEDPDARRAAKVTRDIKRDYGYARGGPVGYGDVEDSYLTGKGSPWSQAHRPKK